jgi:hypothetical protein
MRLYISITSLLVTLCTLSSLSTSYATAVPTTTTQLRDYYARAHSLEDTYDFSPRDGWHSVNASDLGYKYDNSTIHKRSTRRANTKTVHKTDAKSKPVLSLPKLVSHILGEVWNALKGIGKQQKVKITWYTGHDLLNPSCWPNTKWAPTVCVFHDQRMS